MFTTAVGLTNYVGYNDDDYEVDGNCGNVNADDDDVDDGGDGDGGGDNAGILVMFVFIVVSSHMAITMRSALRVQLFPTGE